MIRRNHRPKSTSQPGPLLVAIAGGSGAGKSWLAQQLRKTLGASRTATISLDEFYRDRSHLSISRRAKLNFDNPSAIDWPALDAAATRWLAAKLARIPRYDFSTHCRRPECRVVQPKPILLIEGLWLFRRRSLRNKFGLRIFIECGRRCRFNRRVVRDLRQRGRTAESIKEQFKTTVEPMHLKFVEPQKRWADVIISGNFGAQDVRRIATLIKSRLSHGRV